MGSHGSRPAEKIGLAWGGDREGMTHFDTESEFWHYLLQSVTLGELFKFLELQTFSNKIEMNILPWHSL